MRYELRLAAPSGETVPLAIIAAAIARMTASAGGTPFHRPTYRGKLGKVVAWIVDDAKSGKLAVTDQDGRPGTFDELVQRAEDDGTYSEAKVAQGSDKVDLNMTHALCIYTNLKGLNEWARERGDEFSIKWIGWIDERGWIEPNDVASENPPTADIIPTVLGKRKDRTKPVYSGTRNTSVVFPIDGREAIPVRAIPYMADTTVSADILVRGLLCADHANSLHGLSAYKRLSHGALKISAVEWRRIATKLQALSDGLDRQEKNGELTHAEVTDQWKRKSVELLPAGVFLWKDEFQSAHFKSFRRQSNEELAQSYRDGIEMGRELVSAPEDSYTAELMVAQGAPENWREMVQAGMDEAAAEGPFNPDAICFYVPNRCEPKGTDALSDVTFHPMIEQDEMLIVMQGFEHMSDKPTDERCIELARKPTLGIVEWIELTGVGIGKIGPFRVTSKRVKFVKWKDSLIESMPRDGHGFLTSNNQHEPLEFPCTPARMIDFIDSELCTIYGCFSVPDAFQRAVTESAQATDTAQEQCGPFKAPEKAATAVSSAPQSQAVTKTHRLNGRENILDPVIQLARKNAIDPDSPQSAWTEFVRMAESSDMPAPLIGYVEGEGVKYRGSTDETEFLTKKNFAARVRRMLAKAR